MIDSTTFIYSANCLYQQSSKVIPSELTTVLWFLSMDELLAKTHNHLQPIAMKYLAAVDQHSNELSLFTEDICESMVNTCKFLKACKVKVHVNYSDSFFHDYTVTQLN